MQWLWRLLGDAGDGPWRAALLRRALALFGLGLMAATWRLWTPQTVFPQVPLFAAAAELPAWLQWLGAAGMVAGLAGALTAPTGRMATAALWLFVAATAGMVLLDQQRLQPWAYQFVLVAVVLALAEPRVALALVRLLIVSFYFHSALTKLDYAFLHTLGQQFLAALAGMVGLSLEAWSDSARLAAAAVFPIGELLVAVGLFFPRTRPVGLVAAVLLHALLLVILGPWGLDHKPGVLVWNLYFILQDVLLFWTVRVSTAENLAPPEAPAARVPWPACALIAAAVLLPFLEPTSWFDLWPSWGLYAASAEHVTLEVHRRDEERLSEPLRRVVEVPADARDPWLTVRLDRWALESLGVPIYPQNRVQLGVARGVVDRFGLGHRARIVRFEQAGRFTGHRDYDVLRPMAQLDAAGDEYFFGTRPRANLE